MIKLKLYLLYNMQLLGSIYTKTCKDGQRHAKMGKHAQRHTNTRKDGKKKFEGDKDTKRRTKTGTKMAKRCLKLSKTPKD